MAINSLLIKFFDDPRWVNEYRSGRIRMMSAYHYATLEHGSEWFDNRYDITEGLSYVVNRDSTVHSDEYNLGHATMILGSGVKSMCLNSSQPNKQIKISCFYSIKYKDIPDKRLITSLSTMKQSLGEYYCLFINPEEFLMRVKRKLDELICKNAIHNYSSDYVKYCDINTLNGYSDPFTKPDGLYWQKEYRLLVHTINEDDQFYIEVDDLKDITIWGNKRDLMQGYIKNDDEIYVPGYMK